MGKLEKNTELLEFIGSVVDEIEKYHSDSGDMSDDATMDI